MAASRRASARTSVSRAVAGAIAGGAGGDLGFAQAGFGFGQRIGGGAAGGFCSFEALAGEIVEPGLKRGGLILGLTSKAARVGQARDAMAARRVRRLLSPRACHSSRSCDSAGALGGRRVRLRGGRCRARPAAVRSASRVARILSAEPCGQDFAVAHQMEQAASDSAGGGESMGGEVALCGEPRLAVSLQGGAAQGEALDILFGADGGFVRLCCGAREFGHTAAGGHQRHLGVGELFRRLGAVFGGEIARDAGGGDFGHERLRGGRVVRAFRRRSAAHRTVRTKPSQRQRSPSRLTRLWPVLQLCDERITRLSRDRRGRTG